MTQKCNDLVTRDPSLEGNREDNSGLEVGSKVESTSETRISYGVIGVDEGIYCARPSPLGNPYKVGTALHPTRGSTLPTYREWLEKALAERSGKTFHALRGLLATLKRKRSLTLLCYCPGEPCHTRIIGELLLRELDLD